MNSAQITGRLTKDPVIRATKTGKQVASFTVAVNTRFSGGAAAGGQDREMTAWLPVVAWGHMAEEVRNKLHKGSYVFIEGRIDTRSWDDDKQQRHWVTEINARIISIPFSKREGTGDQARQWGNGQWGDGEWSGEGGPQVPPSNRQPYNNQPQGGQPSDPGNFGRFGKEPPPKKQMEEQSLGFPAGSGAVGAPSDEDIPF